VEVLSGSLTQEVSGMCAERLSQEERFEATQQAQRIQNTINSAIGRRFVRCAAPLKIIRPHNVSVTAAGPGYGIELRIEPLVTIVGLGNEPARSIAATLREWANLLNRAAASLD
jgi:hypothetical protein